VRTNEASVNQNGFHNDQISFACDTPDGVAVLLAALRVASGRLRPDLAGEQGVDGVQPVVHLLLVESLQEVAAVLAHHAECVRQPDHRQLVLGVLDLGGAQVDQGPLHGVFLVPEYEDVRPPDGLRQKEEW
jgi:hypothetical protein